MCSKLKRKISSQRKKSVDSHYQLSPKPVRRKYISFRGRSKHKVKASWQRDQTSAATRGWKTSILKRYGPTSKKESNKSTSVSKKWLFLVICSYIREYFFINPVRYPANKHSNVVTFTTTAPVFISSLLCGTQEIARRFVVEDKVYNSKQQLGELSLLVSNFTSDWKISCRTISSS